MYKGVNKINKIKNLGDGKMKKISNKKILLIAGMMVLSAVSYGKDIFANYGTSFGKVNLSKVSSISPEDAKRIDSNTYQLTGSGEYRITDEGKRKLVVNLSNGTLNGKYDEQEITIMEKKKETGWSILKMENYGKNISIKMTS